MGNKFNVLVSAAIFVTTVYYLWIKIRKRNLKWNENNNDNQDDETEIINNEHLLINEFNDVTQNESCNNTTIHSSDDLNELLIEDINQSGLLTQDTYLDDIISDNRIYNHNEINNLSCYLSVDNVNQTFEQSFTAELCKDFKGLKITTPNFKNTDSSTRINNFIQDLGQLDSTSEINFQSSIEKEILFLEKAIDTKVNKINIDDKCVDELEDGEIVEDDNILSIVENSSDILLGHNVEERIISEQNFNICEKVLVELEHKKPHYEVDRENELEDGEIEFNNEITNTISEKSENIIVNDIEAQIEIINVSDEVTTIEKQVDIYELEEGEIDENDDLSEVLEMKESVEEKKVVVEEIEVVEKTETVKDKEGCEEKEILEGTIVVEEKEVVDEKIIIEETTTVDEKVIIEDTSVVEEKEVVEDQEGCEEKEILEGTIVVEEKEVVDEKIIIEETTTVDEKVIVEEKEVVEDQEGCEVKEILEGTIVVEEKEVVDEKIIIEETTAVDKKVIIEDTYEDLEVVEDKEGCEEKEILKVIVVDEETTAFLEEKELVEETAVVENKSVFEETEIIEDTSVVEKNESDENTEAVKESEVVDHKVVDESVVEEKEVVDEKVIFEEAAVVEEKESDVDDKEVTEEKEIIEDTTAVKETENFEESNMCDNQINTNENECRQLTPEINELKFDETSNGEQSSLTLSETCDYAIEYEDSLDNLITDKNLMNYIDDCLHESSSERTSMTLQNENSDGSVSMENWQNDEDSLNNIKRDFYELSDTVCSPHPSSESDHAHCVNNLTERVATHSAESILDNLLIINRDDSASTPTLSSPIYDNDCCPELYVEKIQFGDKELDVVYFDESVLEECGVLSDVRIVRTIPVGISGRIIGKKGKTKNELLKKYGAELLIYNHPSENCKQVLQITCIPSMRADLEKWADKTLEQILRNTIQTTVSNPEWLKPMIPVGKMVTVQIVDMPTIQHVKLRIHDPKMIRSYNKMQTEMNADYSSADSNALLPSPVAVGCICIAMIRPDYFLRAEIISIYDQYAVVYLYDLGKTHQTCLYYLFKIREKYMRVPFQVIPARMPHAVIKNKKFTSAMVHRRFLCDQKTLRPRLVRAFFPRMNTCCEPCVHLYVSRSAIDGTGDNDNDCVDLLELLVSVDVCSLVRETVNCDLQARMNDSHFKNFLNDKEKRHGQTAPTTPVYFEPCNSKFYEDFLEFQYSHGDGPK